MKAKSVEELIRQNRKLKQDNILAERKIKELETENRRLRSDLEHAKDEISQLDDHIYDLENPRTDY